MLMEMAQIGIPMLLSVVGLWAVLVYFANKLSIGNTQTPETA